VRTARSRCSPKAGEMHVDARTWPGGERVNKMWARLHELTYAASSLHKTAEYLAYAERVRAELEDGRLVVATADRARLIGLLETVSQVLNGPTGAGVIF
jgi:hypothetical protein